MVRQVRFLVERRGDRGSAATRRERGESHEAPRPPARRRLATSRARRVGPRIAAGKGKTAGRGTKGQKARAGGSIPAWFEGGQTPLHMRIPKLRGFKNRFKVEYATSQPCPADARQRKAPSSRRTCWSTTAPARGPSKPLKILGNGDAPSGVTVQPTPSAARALDKLAAAGEPRPAPRAGPTTRRSTIEPEAARRARPTPTAGRAEARLAPGEVPPSIAAGRDDGPPRRADDEPPSPACGASLTRVRVAGQRLPRAGHPAQDPLHARDPDRLPAPGERAGPGRRQGAAVDLFVDNPLFGLLDLFSGGGLATASIVGMGVNPYINASIIMQLMQGVIPQPGRARARRRVRAQQDQPVHPPADGPDGLRPGLRLPGALSTARRHPRPTLFSFETLTLLLSCTAGTILLMWLGELISERGLGNGISFIIFAGIVAALPSQAGPIVTCGPGCR